MYYVPNQQALALDNFELQGTTYWRSDSNDFIIMTTAATDPALGQWLEANAIKYYRDDELDL